MARKESGTVRPTKRKRVFFAAAVLLIVCVLAAGAVSADTVTVSNYEQLLKNISSGPNDRTIIIAKDIPVGADQGFTVTKNITLTTTADANHRIYRIAANTSYNDGMFTIQGNGNLTIQGNTSQKLILDGNKTANTENNQSLVWVAQGGNFTLNSDGVLTNNEAKNSGGAVHVDGGTFTMKDGNITSNNATKERQGLSGNGGGVYISNKGTFRMLGGEISQNTAIHESGGGVYVKEGSFTMEGGKISNNTAMIDSSNTDLTGSGGGVYIENGTFQMSIPAEIGNNTAYHGGGVFMKGASSTFTMMGGTISSNEATVGVPGNFIGSGGGVHIDNGTFTMQGGTITRNLAVNSGGGVYVHRDTGTVFTMSSGEITDNIAGKNGGGVLVNDEGKFTMSDGKISNNTAKGNGGGVYLTQSTFEMFNGEISGNTAESGNGGGVDLRIDSKFTMFGGKITGNTAKGTEQETFTEHLGNGGGVGISYSTFTMSGGTITGNTADTNGNGVYVGGTFNVDNTGTADSVYLPEGKTINVTGTFAGTISGIESEKKDEGTTIVSFQGSVKGSSKDRKYFQLDETLTEESLGLTYDATKNVLELAPTYTVSFQAYEGTPEPEDQTVTRGDPVDEPTTLTKDGHTFAGWHDDEAFTKEWDFTAPVTKDLILHAKWIPNEPSPEPPSGGSSGDGNMENAYRVLFNDGATTLYIVTDLSAGDKLTKPEDPVKDGYTFAGWHKDTACTQAWDFNDGITGSMTLYAKWTPQETVTPTATATVTPTVTATITSTPTGDTSPAPTSQPDDDESNGDNPNGETTTTPGISLPYLIGGIAILLLAILLLLFLLLRHTVTFLIPTGGELEEYRIKVWHGRYINTEDLPALIRTAAW